MCFIVPPGVGVTDIGEVGGLNTKGVPGVNPGDMGFEGVEVPEPSRGEVPRLNKH